MGVSRDLDGFVGLQQSVFLNDRRRRIVHSAVQEPSQNGNFLCLLRIKIKCRVVAAKQKSRKNQQGSTGQQRSARPAWMSQQRWCSCVWAPVKKKDARQLAAASDDDQEPAKIGRQACR